MGTFQYGIEGSGNKRGELEKVLSMIAGGCIKQGIGRIVQVKQH